MRFILFFIILVFSPLLAVAQQSGENCQKQLEYLFNLTSRQPKVSLRGVQGRAVDFKGTTISSLCILLITEDEQKFVAQTITDKNGNFRFGRIPKGEYRLLARVQNLDGASPINLHIKQKYESSGNSFNRKKLVLHLGVAESTDSYAELQ